MNPAVAEWVSKAEGDFLTAGRELRARKSPNYDAVCFHAQQCAEKYLKAVLQENGKRIPKIHFLFELLALILVIWQKKIRRRQLTQRQEQYGHLQQKNWE